jgi:hypothetical protein
LQRRRSFFKASDTPLEIVQPKIDPIQAPHHFIEPMANIVEAFVHIVEPAVQGIEGFVAHPHRDQDREYVIGSAVCTNGARNIAGFIASLVSSRLPLR